MTASNETAARPETGSLPRSGQTSDESPGQSSSAPPEEGVGFFERLAGLFKPRNGATIREEIEEALEETEPGAQAFSDAEREMLRNILQLREVRVEDVMVPRADVEALEVDTSLRELMVIFERSGHSRMPVYAGSLDDPRGMIHIRDVLAHITRMARARRPRGAEKSGDVVLDLGAIDLGRTIGELNLIRTVLFVPPSMLASELMTRMQATRTQMALVIDEYGGTDGLVSLEDIVEMIVGNIEDEHDEDETLIAPAGEGVYVVDGKAAIEDVAEAIGAHFVAGEHEDYVDTVGGMIFNTLGRVPARGEVVQAIPGFEFHVLEADPRRVRRVRIVDLSRIPTSEQPAPAQRA